MEQNQKLLLHAAESIRSHLFRLSRTSADIYLPEEHWSDCQSLVRQLRWAVNRGWNNCQTLLIERLEQRLTSCVERMQRAVGQLSIRSPKARPPALGTIFGELCALSDEFDGFAVDLTKATVLATTERVVLEDIDLGPFEIRLDWKRIGERRCYRVIALEPNPACEASDVTHPHVKSEQLCEGEGQEAIRRALLSGRLSDFFQVVTQILHTYNGGSAYTSLSEWEGVSCGDCGQFVSEDDRSYCEHCDQDLCVNCLEPCAGCEYRFCHSCTDPCHFCDSRLCPSCRRSCDRCERVCCASCLSENNLCGECQDQESNEDTLDQMEESTPEVAAAVAPAT
jgi:hypothetical protein